MKVNLEEAFANPRLSLKALGSGVPNVVQVLLQA